MMMRNIPFINVVRLRKEVFSGKKKKEKFELENIETTSFVSLNPHKVSKVMLTSLHFFLYLFILLFAVLSCLSILSVKTLECMSSWLQFFQSAISVIEEYDLDIRFCNNL